MEHQCSLLERTNRQQVQVKLMVMIYRWADQQRLELKTSPRLTYRVETSLLTQALQMYLDLSLQSHKTYTARGSLSDIRKLLQTNQIVLDQVAQRSAELRKSHPTVRVPNPIRDVPIDDFSSVYSAATSREICATSYRPSELETGERERGAIVQG